MKSLARTTLAAALAAVSLAFTAVPARADLVFDLTDLNATGYGGPFAQVTVHLNTSTQALLTFDAYSGFVLMDGSSAAANINGSFSFGSVTGTRPNATFTQATYADGGSGQVNGFGVFNQTINSSDGFQSGSDIIQFVVNATGTNTWATANDVLVANKNNALAAAHIGVCMDATGHQTSTCTASYGALYTGYAAGNGGGGTIIEIPEPNALALALLGFGLVGVSYSTRRKS